jgi:hypothetical protein
MKASLAIDSLFLATLVPEGEVFTMNIQLRAPGKAPSWSGVLTPEEKEQFQFIISRVSKGEIVIGEGQNLLAELPVYLETIKRQVSVIDELKKQVEAKKDSDEGLIKKISELEEALGNQKKVIDDLRGKLASAVHSERPATFPLEVVKPKIIDAEVINETPAQNNATS